MARLIVLLAIIFYLLISVLSNDQNPKSSIISEICTRALTEGTFGGQLTSLTWESNQNQSLDKAVLLLVFGGSGGIRIAQKNMHHDSMLISEAEDTIFHIDQGLINKLTEITAKQIHVPIEGLDKDDRLPVLGYYTLSIKNHQRNAGQYIFLFNKLWMLRKTVGQERLLLFYNYTLFSTIHGQAEKDVITSVTKDVNSEHYLFSPVRLDIHNSRMDIMLSTVETDTATERSYYPVLMPSGHLRLVHVKKGPPSNSKPMFGKSLPQGTVSYITGFLYLFDDDLGCVYTVENWGRMDFWERSDNDKMDINLPVYCTPYERFFNCPEKFRKMSKKAKNLDPSRCNCRGGGSLDQQKSSFTFPFMITLISIAILILSATFLTFHLSSRRRRGSNRKRKLSNSTSESVLKRSLSTKKVPRRVVKPKAAAKSVVAKKLHSSSKTSINCSRSNSKRSPFSSASEQSGT